VTVVFDVKLCRFRRVMGCVVRVALRRVRVVGGRFVVALLVVPRRVPMVLGRELVVLGSLVVMLRRLLGHSTLQTFRKESCCGPTTYVLSVTGM
jgi:hypothetical protein